MERALRLDRRVLDRARMSRDRRFDGQFFIAVTSTGIYCRPICPAPSPKASNVRYYPSAVAAAEAGFRPCLRCRPEAAPGTPAWMGTSTVVKRALRLISEGALDEASVEALAARVGIGERQLHRLFIEHVGASPITVAQTRRLHFAKRLLDETTLPITEIALASGFGSVRRFNDAFQKTYQRAPRDIRRLRQKGVVAAAKDEVVLRLAYRSPYDWAFVRDYLRERAIPGVEEVDDVVYTRTIAVDGGAAIVAVRQVLLLKTPKGEALELRVQGGPSGSLFQISSLARRVFDLESDPEQVAIALRRDPLLAPLVKRRKGLRIPGGWDVFECTVRAALEHALGVEKARKTLGAMTSRSGVPLKVPAGTLTHLFPTPAAMAAMSFADLAIPPSCSAALQRLSRAVASGAIDLEASPETVVTALTETMGAGLAAEVALRTLSDPDAFSGDDVALRRRASSSGTPISARALVVRAEAWRPWRGYAALYLGTAPELASRENGKSKAAIRARPDQTRAVTSHTDDIMSTRSARA